MARFKRKVGDLEAEAEKHAREYVRLDASEKKAKKAKAKAKKAFNEAADRLVELTRPLARKTVTVTAEDLGHGFGVDDWIAEQHPGWRVIDMEPGDGEFVVALEEDPALQKFHVVVDGKVVGRTINEAAATFDAEGYRIRWLDEGDEATADLLVKVEEVVTYELNEEAAQRFQVKHPEEVATMQSYTTPGTITTKMNPVRKATEDD